MCIVHGQTGDLCLVYTCELTRLRVELLHHFLGVEDALSANCLIGSTPVRQLQRQTIPVQKFAIGQYRTVGWNDFWGNKIGHISGCAKLLYCRSQFQNLTLKCCVLAWRRASKKFDSYPKMGKYFVYIFFCACVSLFVYELKNEEKLKTNCFTNF